MVEAEGVPWSVDDGDPLDDGIVEIVRLEELWLRLPASTASTVPVEGTLAVKRATGGSFDGELVPADRDQRTFPFCIAEGIFSLEDDL